jgi:hypothetical protein
MALIIDASGEYLSRTTNLIPNFSGDVSICFWMQYISNNGNGTAQYPLAIGSGADHNNTLGGYVPFETNLAWRITDGQSVSNLGALPTNGVWYWLAVTNGYSAVSVAGGTPVWNQEGTFPTGTNTNFTLGTHWSATTTYWISARILAVKMWTGNLGTTAMDAERYYYDPQVTSNVHAWYPLISDATDHSANAYNMTTNGSPTYDSAEPVGMNPLGGGTVHQRMAFELR